MIQQYRKASAKALKINLIPEEGGIVAKNGYVAKWQPDIDANQMLMVWELMIKREGCGYVFDSIYRQMFEIEDIDEPDTKAIKLATMKVFMKTIKTTINQKDK